MFLSEYPKFFFSISFISGDDGEDKRARQVGALVVDVVNTVLEIAQ